LLPEKGCADNQTDVATHWSHLRSKVKSFVKLKMFTATHTSGKNLVRWSDDGERERMVRGE